MNEYDRIIAMGQDFEDALAPFLSVDSQLHDYIKFLQELRDRYQKFLEGALEAPKTRNEGKMLDHAFHVRQALVVYQADEHATTRFADIVAEMLRILPAGKCEGENLIHTQMLQALHLPGGKHESN